MTATYLLLAAGFLLPVASIGRDMWREEMRDRTARDIASWEAGLAERRESVLPVDWHQTWPRRQTPSDLPARVGLIVAVDRPGRHRAPEPLEELTTTGQFWAIVEGLGNLNEPCAHCATPEDGEPAHAGCPGCACPCTLEEVSHVR